MSHFEPQCLWELLQEVSYMNVKSEDFLPELLQGGFVNIQKAY